MDESGLVSVSPGLRQAYATPLLYTDSRRPGQSQGPLHGPHTSSKAVWRYRLELRVVNVTQKDKRASAACPLRRHPRSADLRAGLRFMGAVALSCRREGLKRWGLSSALSKFSVCVCEYESTA